VGAVTAREILALLERRGARLLAGEAGLDRPVTWASAMRARPPAFESLQGGELALLALGTLRALHAQDDSLTLERLVADLAERRVAAIAVVGLLAPQVPRGLACPTTLSTDLANPAAQGGSPSRPTAPPSGDTEQREPTREELALAEVASLPLLALPTGTSLHEVERDIIAYVVARRSADATPELVNPRDVYDALLRASLRGDDDRALGQRLAAQLGVAVALEDDAGLRWTALPARFPLAREALVALLRRPSSRAEVRNLQTARGRVSREASSRGVGTSAAGQAMHAVPLGNELLRLIAPVDAREGVAAYLSLVAASARGTGESGSGEASPEGDVAALSAVVEQVVPLFALALARGQDLAGVKERLRVETLDALLAGTYADEDQMRSRAAEIGHDLARPHAALVVEIDARAGGGAAHGTPSQLAAAVTEAFASAPEGIWTRARGSGVVALLPVATGVPSGGLADVAAQVAVTLGRTIGAPGPAWSAGLGELAVGPAEVRRSYGEARDAARLGLLVLGPRRVARSGDLGIYRLLLRLRDTGELQEFCARTLAPLLADTRTGEVLLGTLDVFFACNGNLSEAARRLDLHRNSLIYRLGRARELLGHDLDDPEMRLSLQLALKARRVLTV
jgi:PucR family transcriptional regulator, purine catabolism regulatory protein